MFPISSLPDACSTRSTPKARSSYISQLHQQQQYPRPAHHYPPLPPRHPSPIADTPSVTPPERAPYPQPSPSNSPQQQQQQQDQEQSPQQTQAPAQKPRHPLPIVSDLEPTQRPNVTFRTYPCPEAYAKWYCLNGAQCFSVKIGESVLYNCECADGYMGQRCEFKDLDGTYIRKYLFWLSCFVACMSAPFLAATFLARFRFSWFVSFFLWIVRPPTLDTSKIAPCFSALLNWGESGKLEVLLPSFLPLIGERTSVPLLFPRIS